MKFCVFKAQQKKKMLIAFKVQPYRTQKVVMSRFEINF
jgi:hypothetical protein